MVRQRRKGSGEVQREEGGGEGSVEEARLTEEEKEEGGCWRGEAVGGREVEA